MGNTRSAGDLIQDLIEDINEKKTILLLGPEILQIDEKPLIRYTHQKLLERVGEEIIYYYDQDSLFLFRDEDAKLNAPRQLKRIYRELVIDNTIFKKILEIPFHLIISLNPDTFLTDIASGENYSVPHHFSHFRFMGEVALDEIPEATKENPLFYNLCGCIREDESMVLDYEDLFGLLQSILGPDGIPNKIKTELRKARSFLFLGFDFEKWYSQLLLQLLTGERKGSRKLAINTTISNPESRDFLLHQFRIEFLNKSQGFFQALHEKCTEIGLLRELKKPIKLDTEKKVEIKNLIARNEINDAIQVLKRMTIGSSVYDEIILLEGRYNSWRSKFHGGTLYPRESEITLNQIREDLIQGLNQFL
jgi:hypothetical protein